MIVPINSNAYLFKRKDGIWMFQIFVPRWLRHIHPCKIWRKTTSTRDIEQARRFRDHLLLEWEALKRQHNPFSLDQHIAESIAS
ncbi:TPA: DUF6538 domain-containing protein, partial [Klebsiella pneumoniae]